MNAVVAEILLLALIGGQAVWLLESMHAATDQKTEAWRYCGGEEFIPDSCEKGLPVVHQTPSGYVWCHPLLYKTGEDLAPGALKCLPLEAVKSANGAVVFAGKVVERNL